MPRKQCHTFVRSRGSRVLSADTAMVKLFDYTQKRESGWETWQFRTVSLEHAHELEAAGKAVKVTRMKDGVVCCVGYKALTPTRAARRSPCTLTLTTMKVICKRAMGELLDDRERDQANKFDVWALVGDTKAPAVRPRISEAERKRAEHLLGAKWLPIGMTFAA